MAVMSVGVWVGLGIVINNIENIGDAFALWHALWALSTKEAVLASVAADLFA
eukprot:m.5935 g.5935  ORF g.5935 m.5935 type:complete len:52 (+) comp4660_c0_seq1:590-745(+)